MGKLTGAVLIVAGVTIAAYALSERQRTGAEGPAPVVHAEAKTSATPGSVPPQSQAKPDDAAPETPPPASTAPPAAAKSPEPRPQPTTGKFIPPGPLRISEAPPRVPVDRNKPAHTAPSDREGLTREIQRQLKRVGCYGGAITGVWSPAVRRAMKAFTDRANATLPIEQPDQILLALVQNNQQVTCSAGCPPGQAVGGNGRCLPNALVVRAKKPNTPAKEATPTPSGAPDDASGPIPAPAGPPSGRMSLAGPPPPPKHPTRFKAATSAYSKNGLRYAPAARPPRHADTRRERRRAAARASPGPYSGMPWWAIPAFSF